MTDPTIEAVEHAHGRTLVGVSVGNVRVAVQIEDEATDVGAEHALVDAIQAALDARRAAVTPAESEEAADAETDTAPKYADRVGDQPWHEEDERVVTDGGVATVAQDTGATADDHRCPTCPESFDSERALNIHHARAHDESLVTGETATCAHCGTTFEPGYQSDGVYCSRECVGRARDESVECTCETCGETFTVPPSRAEDRKYCSQDCYGDALRSIEGRRCDACGRRFRPESNADRQYCCKACYGEAHAERPRPDHHGMLLWLLYVYEGHDATTTYRRQRAHLGHEDCLTETEVRDVLRELGVYDSKGQLRKMLEDADPDLIGGETPDGDESWKRFQDLQGGVGDD